jgi:hypothetical protein
MLAVAMAIALSVPIVSMDDSEAEEVIAGIPGIGDEINMFRSVAMIRAAKAHYIIHRRTERALEKKWGSKGQPPMGSEDGELLIEALKQADATWPMCSFKQYMRPITCKNCLPLRNAWPQGLLLSQAASCVLPRRQC